MDFIEAIHRKCIRAVKNFKIAEADLILAFQEMDETRAYLEMKHTSSFAYFLSLGLSEDVLGPIRTVSRKAKEVPALQAAIQNGVVTVSKVRKITSVLTNENQEEWLEKAQTLSCRNLEKAVVEVNPRAASYESVKPVAKGRLELKLGISEEFEKKLKRVQDLESQRTSSAATLEQALEAAVDIYLERKDPVKKAERNLNKSGAHVTNPASGAVPANIKHQVNLRDGGQCTHIANGVRCASRRWVDVHHIRPRSAGGDHSLHNLATLCKTHHAREHMS